MPRDEADELVDAIYDAATADEPTWRAVFTRIAKRANVAACGVKIEHGKLESMEQTWSGLEAGFEEAYVAEYWRDDPWSNASRTMERGRFFRPTEIISEGALAKTRFYQELCRPWGLGDLMGACLYEDENHYVTFGMMRPWGSIGDGSAEAAVGEPLIGHLRRAVRLRLEAREAGQVRGAAAASLDALPFPALVVDEAARIKLTNRAADELVARGDGLRATAEGLTATFPADERALRLAIATAARSPRLQAGGEVVLRRFAGTPLRVIATPARGREGGRRLVVVHVLDPERRSKPQQKVLTALFDLTPAEARLATALAEGRTPAACAARFGVAITTIRTQLRALFRKTGTKRQSDLVRVLVASAG